MAYQPPSGLQLVYDPNQGSCHFVLYSEPPGIGPGIALNGGKILVIDKTADGKAVTTGSPYAKEWAQRLGGPRRPADPHARGAAKIRPEGATGGSRRTFPQLTEPYHADKAPATRLPRRKVP